MNTCADMGSVVVQTQTFGLAQVAQCTSPIVGIQSVAWEGLHV